MATIIDSQMTQEKICRNKSGSCSLIYKPHFVYQFSVKNKHYTSSKIDFGVPPYYSDKDLAEKHLSEHPVESRLTVYYDPKNPYKAVMVPGKTYGPSWWQCPLLGFIISLAVMISNYRRWG